MTFDGDKSLDERIWKPHLLFFRCGEFHFYSPWNRKTEPIQWNFRQIKKIAYPITVTQCEFDGFGIKMSGFGDGVFLKNSLIQSFAEGWERLWMRYLTQNRNTLFPGLENSNGYAAGRTSKEALDSSKGELIERAIFLEAWAARRGWRPYQLRSVRSKMLKAVLKTQGWRTRFFLFSDKNLGVVLGGLIQHKQFGAVFDAAYTPDIFSRASVECKLLRSLIRCSPIKALATSDLNWSLPQDGAPQDHAKYYADPGNDRAFEFLDDPKSAEGIFNLPNPSEIVSKIIVSTSEFPAVAVSFHSKWPQLQWGKQSIRGDNLWPHPLA